MRLLKHIGFALSISYYVLVMFFMLHPNTELLYVTGRSMGPTFFEEQVVVLERITNQELSIGDIVTVHYADKPLPVIHRIVETAGIFVVTQGDNNDHLDPMINRYFVTGRVLFSIPYTWSVQTLLLFSSIGYMTLYLFHIINNYLNMKVEKEIRRLT